MAITFLLGMTHSTLHARSLQGGKRQEEAGLSLPTCLNGMSGLMRAVKDPESRLENIILPLVGFLPLCVEGNQGQMASL
jgi:hypothetical protein